MNAKEAIEQLKWYFECDDGIAAEMVTKEAYQIAVQALEENECLKNELSKAQAEQMDWDNDND